jgi:hypothetical protein
MQAQKISALYCRHQMAGEQRQGAGGQRQQHGEQLALAQDIILSFH